MMKISIRCSFLAILCAIGPLICFGQLPTTWHTYVAKGERFSLRFPEAPMEISITRPVKSNEKQEYGRGFITYSDGAAYLMISLGKLHRKDTLDSVIKEFPQLSIFCVGFEFDRDTTLGELKSRQYRVSSKDVTGLVQFVDTGNHFYVVEVVADKLATPMTDKFFSSVRIHADLKGKEIVLDAPTVEIERVRARSTVSPPGSIEDWTNEVAYSAKNVDRAAKIIAKPEPEYTEEAKKEQVMGTVILRGILSSSGKVTNVYSVAQLPNGLTEQAVAVSKLITFLPALKDGKRVSQNIQIEYNFNLY